MILVRRHFELQQARQKVLLGEGYLDPVAVVIVAGISLADAAEHGEDVIETVGADQ
ncbi:hypothetical protein D3C71_2111270 [compost metagenome]